MCVVGMWGDRGTSRARIDDRDNREGRGGIKPDSLQRPENLEEISPVVTGSQ